MKRSTPAETSGRAAYPAPAPPAPDAPASVCLQYRDQAPIRVRGLGSGRLYEFSGRQPVQAVDQRDASALLQSRLFSPCASP